MPPVRRGLEGGQSVKAGLRGWRRSADRTRLQANSLLTGNFTGNFAILVPCAPGSTQDTAVLQRFLAQFPKQIIREKISKNRVFLGDYQGIWSAKSKGPFLAHLSL